jgi:predicted metalloprotease with PDZ domain
VAVALDGLALTVGNCDRRLRSYRAGDKLDLVVFRGDELLSMRVKLVDAPETTCFLKIDNNADAVATARRAAWLQSD